MDCMVSTHQYPPSAPCTPFTNHVALITQTLTQMWTAWEDPTAD